MPMPADSPGIGRRDALKLGAALAVPPLMAGVPAGAQEAGKAGSDVDRPMPARAYGARRKDAPLEPMEIRRRAVGTHDVLLDVLFCGICHSDIHQARDEWADWGPTRYPCVPGHEIVGRVLAVGAAVTKFKVGDLGGVGCLVDSCRSCDPCRADREQYCLQGATFTYNSPDRHGTARTTYGGYADRMVVAEAFVLRIPPGADLAATAPLLCAGITTFSPMQHWKLGPGQRVAVVGLGGLGHLAVKLAAARRAEVTVLTTSPGKLADAKRLGAADAVLSSDEAAVKRLANRFDLMIATVPRAIPIKPFLAALKQGATLVNVGAMEQLQGVTGIDLVNGRKSVAGSMIGGIAETQEVVDYCAARNIKADVEVIRAEEVNRAFDRVVNKDVRYRFVIDAASLKG
jgi:uncharacterized zinc-type alcohol dehydrogenase-like protein